MVDQLGIGGQHLGGLGRIHTGHQHRRPLVPQGAGDGRDLFGGFALAENDLRETLAQRPVVVHPGEAQVLVRELLQALHGLGWSQRAGGHLLQQRIQLVGVHRCLVLSLGRNL